MLKEGHHNLIGKSSFVFYVFLHLKRAKEQNHPHTYGHPNDEIRNVIGKLLLRLRVSGPIHCPTNIVSIRMFRDMNKIPIEAGAACFISSFFMSVVPNSSSYIFFFFLRATHLVIQFLVLFWD
jgi:hypothetical protein